MLPAPCSLNISTSHLVGINKEQEKALRKRGRGPPEKQWNEVYKILFPLVPEELIPSPHYEDSIDEWEKRRLRDLDQMESYLRSELSQGVRKRLEQKSLQLPHPLENLIKMVESAQTDAFQSFRHRQQGTQLMEVHGPDTSFQTPTSAQQSQTTYGYGLEATMEASAFTTMTATAYDGMGQQNEQAGLMDNQILNDMDLFNWNIEAP
ncbi:hypothetical protein CGCSCA4_v004205 [Colletotrichum siamense]|uniref:Uncharacterized protein n=1 Tax=Colletotrichum siamense TaxID=690259 RepID=A0A9P5F0B4_COLSI|nr:hypothetical protein CGCSCA4_v004205 [Colletotrichum siamense]KAF4863546.1 hypothetical protein CGCSCA2_v002938 [Colletotrichum siamense]